jgi:hypothetical protein
MMTAPVLDPGGSTIWRVTTPAGERWLRLRKGGGPLALPEGSAAEAVSLADAADVAEQAPAYLRQLWRLAEAAPAWGWSLRQLPGTGGGPVVGWCLAVTKPDGSEASFTWVMTAGGGMRLVAQTETVKAVRGQLGSP